MRQSLTVLAAIVAIVAIVQGARLGCAFLAFQGVSEEPGAIPRLTSFEREGVAPPWMGNAPLVYAERLAQADGGVAAAAFRSLGPSNAKCLANRGCTPIAPLPLCSPDLRALDVSALLASAPALSPSHGVVNVRGHLGVGEERATLVACGLKLPPGHRRSELVAGGCCNAVSARIALSDGVGVLWLDRLGCFGDESMACCNGPAYGQRVVATGRLRPENGDETRTPESWALTDLTLCTLESDDPRPR